jgi:hypothetical protein
MPTTYAPQPATISGDLITVNRLVNSPALIQRTLRTLIQQRLVANVILTGSVDLTGSGAVNYEIAEAIMSNLPSEIVDALMEYPLTDDTPATSAMASTAKWGLSTLISDEMVARNRMDQATRKLIKLANRIAFGFDALCLSAVASQVTQTQAASASWTSSPATADPFADVALAIAQVDTLNQGYAPNMLLASPVRYARLISASKVVAQLPREGGDAFVLTGRMFQWVGLTIVKTTNLPAGVDAMVLDSTMLGSIAWEDLGGPGWLGAANDVQSKRIRKDDEDGWKIMGRRVGVPLVQEPACAVKITNT